MLGNVAGVHRSSAAEGKQRHTPVTHTPVSCVGAGGRRHGLAHHAENAVGSLVCADSQLVCQRADGGTGLVPVQGHVAAQEILGIENAQHHVRIRHAGVGATAAIAGGAGVAAGAVRTYFEQPKTVHPSDGASAGTDLNHVDGRDRHRHAAARLEAVASIHFEFADHQRFAVLDEARFCGSAPHVEGHQAVDAVAAGDEPGDQGARRGSRLDHAYRVGTCYPGADHAAVRQHDQRFACQATVLQRRDKRVEIGSRDWRCVGIDSRGAGAQVLPHLRRHVAGQGHHDLRCRRREGVAKPPFVFRVAIAVQETHGDRLDVRGAQLSGDALNLGRCDLMPHGAVGVGSLAHAPGVLSGNQRLGILQHRIKHVVAMFVPDVQNVTKSLGDDQPGG